MAGFVEKVLGKEFSRRSFLKGTAAATAAVASLNALDNSLTAVAEESVIPAAQTAPVDPEQGGKWKNAACWHNCGGRCVNKVYVVDGVVVRQKTDDTHPDSPDYPQQRGCVRGRSQQQQCFAPDRLKYPMKRKHWEPHTGGDKSLRGKDEWVRISWEEALDLVAEEMRYCKETYGNDSILYPSWATYWGWMSKLLGMSSLGGFGGYSEVADTGSYGAFDWNTSVMGIYPLGMMMTLDRISLRKADYIVLHGGNPAWATGGNTTYHLLQAKKAGAQYIYIGPEFNYTASLLDAKWIRVRPGTDTAFLLAVAYEMLRLDGEKGGIIDWDMLNRCSVGFDAEHMPADAQSNENFKDYILGAYDGIPKTAQWASEICGTPAEDIIWYAETIGKQNNVTMECAYAPARCNNAEDFPQVFFTVGMMGGHWGREGNCCGAAQSSTAYNSAMILSAAKGGQCQQIMIPNETDHQHCLKGPELWKGIVEGKYNYTGNYLMGEGTDRPSEERKINVQMIIHESHNFLQSQMNIMKGIEAHRKVGFVVSMSSFLNASAQYSDIVLPVTTMWEREDACSYVGLSNPEMLFVPEKVVEPMFEAKDDAWIVRELANRLGLDGNAILPLSDAQAKFNYVVSMTRTNPDYSTTPVATITQEDIDRLGVQGTPQEGLIPIAELYEKGVYQVPRSEGDGYAYVPFQYFVMDPENEMFRLSSKSGKFEIYCQQKADIINAMKRSTVKPYPTYIKPLKGYEESFSDWGKKIKGEYPYQVTNPHYLRRAHTALDNIPWLRETMPNPVWINASDAKEKGVAEGDTVLIYNEFGKVLRNATLTERLIPGVLALPHGTWLDLDEETGIDRGGSDNVLCGSVSTGIGISGYNTTLVNFKKYDGPALEPDWKRTPKAIEL